MSLAGLVALPETNRCGLLISRPSPARLHRSHSSFVTLSRSSSTRTARCVYVCVLSHAGLSPLCLLRLFVYRLTNPLVRCVRVYVMYFQGRIPLDMIITHVFPVLFNLFKALMP